MKKFKDHASENQTKAMYGKLFNRLKRGCQTFKDSARSIRTRSKSASAVSTTSKGPPKDGDTYSDSVDFSSKAKIFDFDLDSSSQEGSIDEFEKRSNGVEQPTSTSRIENYTSTTSSSYTDQFWLGLINSPQYKNWLKIGLALRHFGKMTPYISSTRSVCDFISPVLEEIVHGMHTDLLDKHGNGELTQEHVLKFKQNCPESDMLRGWVRDILKWHRSPPQPSEIFKVCDVGKWPTYDGAWEIARVFMSRGFRSGGTGGDASSFDVSALLNFMQRCRLMDGYVNDFNTVKRVLQVRNMTMHSPRLEVDDEMLEESFRSILNLLQDEYLSRHAEKYIKTSDFFQSIEEIKTSNFDLVTSAKHSLNLLKDGTFGPNSNSPHPSANTLILLRDVLTRILSLPEVHVSANFIKIQNEMTEMEEKVAKTYEEADERIRQMTAHVFHINRQLDRLRDYFARSKESKGKESFSKLRSKKTKKSKKSKTTCTQVYEPEIPYPAGYKRNTAKPHIITQANATGAASKLISKTLLLSESSTSDDDFYQFEEKRVRYNPSLQSNSSKAVTSTGQPCCSRTRSRSSLFDKTSSVMSTLLQQPFPGFQISVSSALHTSPISKSTEAPTRKRKKEKGSELTEEILAKRKRSKGPNKQLNSEIASGLIPVPDKSSGSGGGYFSSCRVQLEVFLNKQPHNSGATFRVNKHSDGKYHCAVTFQSNFAISSSQPSSTQEEAEYRAALEANKWIIGSSSKTDLESAKTWFDAYSLQVVGKLPAYTSFQTSSDLFVSYAHLINNKLFLFTDSIDAHKLFLEATCRTLNSDVNVERMAIKTALQGTPMSPNEKVFNRQTLNDFCLHNGGTLPVIHTTSYKHPKTGKMSWTCSLKSFSRDYLCQAINHFSDAGIDKVSSETDAFDFIPSFADFLESQCIEPQRTAFLAEDSAACGLLEKLGLNPKQLVALKGKYKKQLELYAYEMDLSAAYHTVQVKSKELNNSPQYDCVVSSLCLHDTKQTFTVTSDEAGFKTSEEASESAARNALILLGQNVSSN